MRQMPLGTESITATRGQTATVGGDATGGSARDITNGWAGYGHLFRWVAWEVVVVEERGVWRWRGF